MQPKIYIKQLIIGRVQPVDIVYFLSRRNIMKNSFSKNLKKLRKEEGLSQEQLAELLGVSRQSVSKWETSDAYPEMDKILFLCNEFNLNINDLLNGDITEVKHKNETIKEINKGINKIVNFFVDSLTMFFQMTLKSKLKFIFELFFLGFVLIMIFLVIGQVFESVMSSLIYNLFPSKIVMIIKSLLAFVYYAMAAFLSLIVIVEIVNNRYLKYFNENTLETNFVIEKHYEGLLNEEMHVETKKKEKQIIIRDPEDSGYEVSSFLIKIIRFTLKALLALFLIPLIVLILFLAFGFVLSFLVYKTGFFFIGLLIILIPSIVIVAFLVILIANVLFNRKSNFKAFIYTTIISLVMIGLGSGLVTIGSLQFDIINEYDSNVFKGKEVILDMNPNLQIQSYNLMDEIKYIEADIDKIKIEYEYNSLLCPNEKDNHINILDYEERYLVEINCYSNNHIQFLKASLKNINENKRIGFSDKIYNVRIYGSEENLKIIKENTNYNH